MLWLFLNFMEQPLHECTTTGKALLQSCSSIQARVHMPNTCQVRFVPLIRALIHTLMPQYEYIWRLHLDLGCSICSVCQPKLQAVATLATKQRQLLSCSSLLRSPRTHNRRAHIRPSGNLKDLSLAASSGQCESSLNLQTHPLKGPATHTGTTSF